MPTLSLLRLVVMRIAFFLLSVVFGITAWSRILAPPEMWDSVRGIAYSFLAALSLLSLIGIRFPIAMLPLLLLQFTYKVIWFAGIAYPLWQAGELPTPLADPVFRAFAIGIAVDLIAIPWAYAFSRFIVGTPGSEPGPRRVAGEPQSS